MQNLCGSCLPNQKHLKKGASSTGKTSRPSSFTSGPKIIIVGGGAAGLACGVKLIEYGFKDVRILEARQRIGGRIFTVPFADNNVDMGAQWVHGEKDNIVYEMVKNRELLETSGDVYVSFHCIRSNGEIVSDKVVQDMKDLLGDIFMNRRSDMAQFDGSFGEFLQINFFEALNDPKYADLDHEIVQEFFENFKKMESSESSLGLEEISARGFLEYWDCEGDYMLGWKERGYQEFLRVLTKAKYGVESPMGVLASKVVFDARVNLIEWDREEGNVRVTCENMDSYDADNVVVTVSLGVLKHNAESMFEPALPEQKLTAIRNLGYGDVFKVFLEFPNKFWPTKWTGFTTLWRKEDLEQLEAAGMSWLQEIYGFYLVSYQPRVLQAWAVGPAVQLLEQMPSQELETHLVELLKRFLPTWTIPKPVSIIASSWSSNKDFRGAYSFRTLQAESVNTGASTLAFPLSTTLNIPIEETGDSDASGNSAKKKHPPTKQIRYTIKPTVLFAGEATSSHYFSTVHGAVESGFREAKRLAGYYEYET